MASQSRGAKRTSPPVPPTVSPSVAIAGLTQLKTEAQDTLRLYQQGEAARESWRSRVQSVLNNGLGSNNELSEKVRALRWGLFAWDSDTRNWRGQKHGRAPLVRC